MTRFIDNWQDVSNLVGDANADVRSVFWI